jgi:signal transduction histidine kinase/streptogramin lyase
MLMKAYTTRWACMRTYLVMIACFADVALRAQLPPPAVLHKLDIPGLPAETVHDLDFDKDGFLWISTGNGLCRYDGVNLDVLRNDPRDTASLTNNTVGRCMLLPDGRLLAGTNAGLAVVDTREMTVARIAAPKAWSKGGCTEVAGLTLDARGRVWICDRTLGLLRFHPGTNRLERIYPSVAMPGPHERPGVHAAVMDPDGSLWVIDLDHLLHIDTEGSRMETFRYVDVQPAPAPKPLLVRMQAVASDPNFLVIGSWGSGLITFDKRTRSFSTVKRDTGKSWNVSNIVLAITAIDAKVMAVGLNWATYWYDPHTRRLSEPFVPTIPFAPHLVDQMNAITTDPTGRVWFGGSAGVYIGFDPQHHPVTPMAAGSLGSSMVLARATDHAGFWAARFYYDRKLYALDPAGVPYDSIAIPQGEELQVETWKILCTRDRRIFLGTSDGLLRYDPERRVFSLGDLPYPDGYASDRRHINDLIETPDGDLWASGHCYAFRARAGSEHFEPIGVDTSAQGAWKQKGHKAFALLDPHHLVIATLRKGISVVDLRLGTTADLPFEAAPELLGIEDVVTTPDGLIYGITRNAGIVRMRYTDGTLTDIAVFEDRSERGNYQSAVVDDDGTLWISGTADLVRFDPKDSSFTRYDVRDGMPSLGADALALDSGGTFLNRVSPWYRFDLQRLALRPPPRRLYIRRVLANGQALPITFDANTIELPHDRNSVAIEFAPIDPVYGDERRYAYQLEGYDADWVASGALRTVNYASLAPGTYIFNARIVGIDGPQGRTRLTITIVPAWWQTTWFNALVVLISVLLVFLLSRYILRLQYLRRIAALEKEREVSNVRSRIARDIHDDLGSGLTRITMLSREMQGTTGANEDKGKLAAHIANASSELIGQLGEIVWAVDPQNDHAEGFIAYVRNMLGKQFEELSIGLRTDLTLETGQERRDLPPDVKRNVLLMLKELVNNALKHAQAKTISVRLHIGASALSLIVNDDGHGFDLSHTRPGGNGLGNLRKRAESIGATLTMYSSTSGTISTLTVPLPAPTIMRGPSA